MGWTVGRAPSSLPFDFYPTTAVWFNQLNFELGTWLSRWLSTARPIARSPAFFRLPSDLLTESLFQPEADSASFYRTACNGLLPKPTLLSRSGFSRRNVSTLLTTAPNGAKLDVSWKEGALFYLNQSALAIRVNPREIVKHFLIGCRLLSVWNKYKYVIGSCSS
jgi:hypothetical protein